MGIKITETQLVPPRVSRVRDEAEQLELSDMVLGV